MATTYKLMVIVRQTQTIQSKVVMTKDLQTVTVGALVTYYVDDVVSALAKIADLPSDIMERSQGAIFTEVSERTLEEIQANRAGVQHGLTESVRRAERLRRAGPPGAAHRVCALPCDRYQWPCRGRQLLAVDRFLAREGFRAPRHPELGFDRLMQQRRRPGVTSAWLRCPRPPG